MLPPSSYRCSFNNDYCPPTRNVLQTSAVEVEGIHGLNERFQLNSIIERHCETPQQTSGMGLVSLSADGQKSRKADTNLQPGLIVIVRCPGLIARDDGISITCKSGCRLTAYQERGVRWRAVTRPAGMPGHCGLASEGSLNSVCGKWTDDSLFIQL